MDQYLLKRIQVANFRNLNNDIIELGKSINCIFGFNGNGKTNLLEAIHYISTKKSFRKNTTFPQLINVECENPEIIFQSVFEVKKELKSYSGRLEPKGQQWFFNNTAHSKKIDFKTVFINPFDSYLFHTVPSFRRSWFDTHIGIISPTYKKNLTKYNQALRFRNNLMSKKPHNYKEQAIAISKQLAEYSLIILNERKEFLQSLKNYCEITFKSIFAEQHILEIELESKFKNYTQSQIEEYYTENIEKDSIIGHTRSGIHKDDYMFHFDGFLSYDFCSLGQQKMSFLSLLFAYIELFRYKFRAYPMVLIDDVSGELDERRWKNLISYLEIKNFQVVITTANVNFKNELERIKDVKKFNVIDGFIQSL